jgi:hypothetical protein
MSSGKGEMNAYKVSFANTEESLQLGRFGNRWEANINMDIKQT